MTKLKRMLIGAFAMVMMIAGATSGVFAASQSGTTEVMYENTNEIPDPDDPNAPKWSVKIPSKIEFSDTTRRVDASVELVSIDGGALPATDVLISVESMNGYKLNLATKDDEVAYSLIYAGNTMTNTVTEVGKLNDTNVKISGEAILKGSAKKPGNHTDYLTFTVTK